MTYEEWVDDNGLDPDGLEAYIGASAWKAAIAEAQKIALACDGADDKVGVLIHTELEFLS